MEYLIDQEAFIGHHFRNVPFENERIKMNFPGILQEKKIQRDRLKEEEDRDGEIL